MFSYNANILKKNTTRKCSFDNCSFGFHHWGLKKTIVTLESGKWPYSVHKNTKFRPCSISNKKWDRTKFFARFDMYYLLNKFRAIPFLLKIEHEFDH